MDSDKEARIRERAYEIWVREGRPHGRDAEHWQKAEAEITAESGAAGDRAAAGSKPRTEAPSVARPIAPAPSAGTVPPLRSRRAAAKPARGSAPGTSESGATGRRGRKTPES
ncbi:MAG TPA: DUF2934 domain-containing protein [Stellaceae bacterium]|nr:DUF2934 domain-containing protein [Stellaceae bacterium]